MARTLLVVCGILALLFLALGFAPWSRPGPPLRPAVLPAAALRHFDAATLDKGREFRSHGYGLYFLRKGLVGLLLIGALASGAHLLLRRLPFGPGVLGVTLALLIVFTVLEITRWPFGLYGLSLARAAGISHQSVGSWWVDTLQGLGIFLVETAVAGGVLFWLMKVRPQSWPFWAAGGVAVGGALLTFLIPVLIDPVFNKFTPLQDVALRERFLAVTRQAGVPVKEVLVADASRRTTAVNAYFTGFGPTRRIVLYDTLIPSLTPREADLVIAHEAGHWRLQHIYKGLAMGVVGAGLALWLAAALLRALFGARAFGLTGPLDPAAAVLFVLLYWLGMFLSMPIENAISRQVEAQADQFALDLTRDAATEVAVEVALTKKNLGDVAPPPLARILFFSHPGPLERIAQAERFRASAAPIPVPHAIPDTPMFHPGDPLR